MMQTSQQQQQQASSSAISQSFPTSSSSTIKTINTIKHPPVVASSSATGNGASTTTATYSHHLSFNPSSVFQQVKQTQASLARLSRVHQQLSQTNQPSHSNNNNQQQQQMKEAQQVPTATNSQTTVSASRSTTFVDCLIRRFKDCFSEDFCTVPMFVVGNLSPGSDGTHLILPPCVSLGGQHISRFASPKNLRLMNSIRESCKSIEELDLGGNKLTDLIEIYKILQCTPNLRFLNLSENDLSRTSPVAMAMSPPTASTSASSYSISVSTANLASSSSTVAGVASSGQHWSSSNTVSQRNCLAPINQNQHTFNRRHSTLGQTGSSPAQLANRPTTLRARGDTPTGSRVAEARRLAAAAAVAQSKKTSSSVASKLASSISSAVGSASGRQAAGNSHRMGGATSGSNRSPGASVTGGTSINLMADKDKGGPSSQVRHQAGQASTMRLVRSLSSLSAKDIRGASNRHLSTYHRANGRKMDERGLRGSASSHTVSQRIPIVSSPRTTKATLGAATNQLPVVGKQPAEVERANGPGKGKLNGAFDVEPIAEVTDDIDMAGEPISVGTSNNNNSTTIGVEEPLGSINQQQQSRALALQTGSTSMVSSTSLRTTNNNMISASTQSSSANFRRTFESIKALALNNTGCQWRVVCSILSRMPNLEELHLSLNNYERIDLDPTGFKHLSLKRLYLCNNPKLTNWEELDKILIAFPSLEALSIADCNISQIPDNLDRAREWKKLCGLNINGWPIKEWPVIERLNQLPSLIDLKCRNLEILSTIDEPRHHLIARLPKLKRLNGSEIEEREHAEKAFLRFFMANTHLERPPRFHELVQIHGEVIPVDVDVDLSPPSQAHVRVVFLNRSGENENGDDILMSEDFLIKLMDNVDDQQQENMELSLENGLNIELGDNNIKQPVSRLFKNEAQEVLAIDVDLRQSVRKFKSTLASLFGLSSQNLILYYIDHEMVGLMGPELIKHNQKKLWNYNVQDGDQFIVEER